MKTLFIVSYSEFCKEFFEILYHTEELRDYFVRYLWIFRGERLVAEIFNNSNLPIEVAIAFINFALSRGQLADDTEHDDYVAKITNLFPSDISLRLLSHEDVNQDKTLKINLLTNLDARSWDIFFEKIGNSDDGFSELAQLFDQLNYVELSSLFYRNKNLYESIRMIFVLLKESDLVEKSLLFQIESIITNINRWEEFIRDMKKEFPASVEKKILPNEKDSNRLSILLHELLQIPDKERYLVLDFFFQQELIFDKNELLSIEYILTHYSEKEVAEI